MKKKITSFLLCLCIMTTFVACGSGKDTTNDFDSSNVKQESGADLTGNETVTDNQNQGDNVANKEATNKVSADHKLRLRLNEDLYSLEKSELDEIVNLCFEAKAEGCSLELFEVSYIYQALAGALELPIGCFTNDVEISVERPDTSLMAEVLKCAYGSGYDPEVDIFLGYHYLEYDRDLDKALECFSRADEAGYLAGTFYKGYVLDRRIKGAFINGIMISVIPDEIDIDTNNRIAQECYKKVIDSTGGSNYLSSLSYRTDFAEDTIKSAAAYAYAYSFKYTEDSAQYEELLQQAIDNESGWSDTLSYLKYICGELNERAYSYELEKSFDYAYSKQNYAYCAFHGDVESMSAYGRGIVLNNPEAAIVWFKEAYNRGSVVGAFNLGAVYSSVNSKNLPQYTNAEKCVEYWTEVVDMYEKGDYCIEMAAASNAKDAATYLVQMYCDGDEIPQDLEKAKKYYNFLINKFGDKAGDFSKYESLLKQLSALLLLRDGSV